MRILRLIEDGNKTFLKSDFSDAAALFRQALDLAIKSENFLLTSVTYGHIALCFKNTGEWEQAFENVDLAINVSTQNNLDAILAHSYFHKASIYFEQASRLQNDDIETKKLTLMPSLDFLSKSEAIFRDIDKQKFLLRIECLRGSIFNRLNEFESAITHWKNALAIITELQQKDSEPSLKIQKIRLLISIGHAWYLLDDLEQAVNSFHQCEDLAQQNKQHIESGVCCVHIGICLLKSGNYEDALNYFCNANHLLKHAKSLKIYTISLRGCFESAVAMKNHDLALSVLKELDMIADRDLDEHLKSFVSRAHKFVSTVKASKKLFVESRSSPKKFEYNDENIEPVLPYNPEKSELISNDDELQSKNEAVVDEKVDSFRTDSSARLDKIMAAISETRFSHLDSEAFIAGSSGKNNALNSDIDLRKKIEDIKAEMNAPKQKKSFTKKLKSMFCKNSCSEKITNIDI